MTSSKISDIETTRAALDKVSKSFCAAKWLQVTLHLQNGQGHSCHHPDTHAIDAAAIEVNPSALHNTEHKKVQRAAMLQGGRPPECAYCWAIEDTPGSFISDRHIKSNDPWAKPHLDRIQALPASADVAPTYVEVSFSNLCNFKCAYCAPNISSRWHEEIRQHGPYPTSTRYNDLEQIAREGKSPLPEHEANPYVDAFWNWWPELYETLEVFRITGGEPLLNKNTFRILEYVDAHPNPRLDLAINSNLDVPGKLFESFIGLAKSISQGRKSRTLTVYTSIDAWGPQAEYIRHGLSCERFMANVRRLLEAVPEAELVFTCTFNALSVPSFLRLLEEITALKFRYDREIRAGQRRITLDCSYLRYPEFLALPILRASAIEPLWLAMAYMDSQATYSDFERKKVRRVIAWFERMEETPSRDRLREDFVKFVDEHDRRRGTNFKATFPGLVDQILR